MSLVFFFSGRRRHTRWPRDWSSDVCSSDLPLEVDQQAARRALSMDSDQRIITLMPGSRAGEVNRLGPPFLQTARLCFEQDPDLHFILPAASPDRYRQLHHQLAEYTDLPDRKSTRLN